MKSRFEKYKVNKNNEENNPEPQNKFSKYKAQNNNNREADEGVEKFLSPLMGNFPKDVPYLKPGTKENDEYMKSMINIWGGGAAALPGIGKMAAQSFPMLKAMLGGGSVAAAEHKPGEEHGFGMLPSNKLGAFVEGAALPPILGAGLKYGAKAFKLPFKAFKNLSPLEQKAAAAEQNAFQESENFNQARNLAEEETGYNRPSKMKNVAGKAEEELTQLEKPEQNNLPIEKLEDVESEISKHLNKGAAHDVRNAKIINEEIDKIKKPLNQSYEEIKEDFSNKNVVIDNSKKIQKLLDNVRELTQKGLFESKELKEVANKMSSLQKREIIPANDFLTMFRSVRDEAYSARQKAFKPLMDAQERAEWTKKFNQLDEDVEEMGKLLEDNVGKEVSEKLKTTNKAWRENVIPLYKNRNYQMIKKGRMSENMMRSLRGTEPGDIIIRNIIKNNPEALKNITGQRFAKTPHKLHEAGELEQEYLEHMPELQQMISRHKIAGNQAKSSKIEIQRLQLENKIEKFNKNIKSLEEQAKRKDISLKERDRVGRQLDEERKAKQSARTKLKYIGAIGLSATGIPLASKIFRGLTNTLGD